jgi:hypothetical protein
MQAKEKKQFSNESNNNHSKAGAGGPSGVNGGVPPTIAMSKSIQFTNLESVLSHKQ